MFQKSIAAMALLLVAIGVSYMGAQQPAAPLARPEFEYRVVSLWEMFKGDVDSERKVKEIAGSIRTSGRPAAHRTDMDAKDYEAALNTMAKDGWQLVAVNKSNYWVFRRAR